ncbi:MAG TPA: butyrate kinase [Clostridia bacterium]|nr:butyrate kinase [Clostridia bacterium]
MLRLLVINPGSTSTKFGVFEGRRPVFSKSIRHGVEMSALTTLESQRVTREKLICDTLEEEGISLDTMNAIVGRGGLLHPLEGGVYEVNADMIDDLESRAYGWHSSNLGGILADAIAKPRGLKAYIADPVIVDEMEALARFSGWPAIQRKSIFHALNQKAVARRFANDQDTSYENINLIVAHLGGGISVGAHKKGRVIDVNNALTGDGPFSVERTGGLPLFSVMELCYSGNYTLDDLKKSFVGQGGLIAYLETGDAIEINRRIKMGDEKARLVMEALSYQVAKEIGAAATVLGGEVSAILITGGLAHDPYVTGWITERVDFIAPVTIYPGEDELAALADAVGEALSGRMPIKTYRKERLTP